MITMTSIFHDHVWRYIWRRSLAVRIVNEYSIWNNLDRFGVQQICLESRLDLCLEQYHAVGIMPALGPATGTQTIFSALFGLEPGGWSYWGVLSTATNNVIELDRRHVNRTIDVICHGHALWGRPTTSQGAHSDAGHIYM
jgi:hypothetical protein